METTHSLTLQTKNCLVHSLPIRDGNPISVEVMQKAEAGPQPTYKGWKLPLEPVETGRNKVHSLPIRDGNWILNYYASGGHSSIAYL